MNWFDQLIETMAFAAGEGGYIHFMHKLAKGVDYILVEHDEVDACSARVYAIDDRGMFKQKVQNLVGDECEDPTSDEVQEAAWEVLERYRLVTFDD